MHRNPIRTTPEDAEIIEMLWQRSEEGVSWVERRKGSGWSASWRRRSVWKLPVRS